MGYSLCKILNLSQNFKFPKTCPNIGVARKNIILQSLLPIGKYSKILRKKTARKNTKYSRNETMLKIGHLAKSIAFAWAIAFAKYSIWAKILNCLKYVKIDYSVQKTARKNTVEMRRFTLG